MKFKIIMDVLFLTGVVFRSSGLVLFEKLKASYDFLFFQLKFSLRIGKLIICSFLIVGFLISPKSQAAPNVFSLGLTVGQSAHSSKLLSNASGVEVFLIRKYNKHFSLDIGYTYFGKLKGPSLTEDYINLTSAAKFVGVNISMILDYPINNKYYLFTKTGYSQTEFTLAVESNAGDASIKRSRISFLYGGGLKYSIADDVQLIFMWERYLLGETKSIKLLSGGLLYFLD